MDWEIAEWIVDCRMALLNDENFADSSFVTFVLMILFNIPEKYQHTRLR
jgi:uncharacterized protein Smg (DUF494 family)